MKLKTTIALFLLTFNFALSASALAGSPLPCIDKKSGIDLPIDDGKVINWKLSTPNQFAANAHVSGPITKLYADQNGHNHFEIKIGPNPKDTLEVIYNISFGSLGAYSVGMQVEACGEYITSNAPAGTYVASPDGAIIHYIHKTHNAHTSGFLIINGKVFGQGNGSGG